MYLVVKTNIVFTTTDETNSQKALCSVRHAEKPWKWWCNIRNCILSPNYKKYIKQ